MQTLRHFQTLCCGCVRNYAYAHSVITLTVAPSLCGRNQQPRHRALPRTADIKPSVQIKGLTRYGTRDRPLQLLLDVLQNIGIINLFENTVIEQV